MAGDWIKMRVWLARDPRVIRMADYLSNQREFMNWLTDPVQQSCKASAYEHVTRNVISALCVTGLLVTWGTAREQGDRDNDDLVLAHSDASTFDAITDVPCFGDAMVSVGWLVENEDGSVSFPKFFKDNETPDEKHKRQNAERQANYRAKKQAESNVTVDVTDNVTNNVTVTTEKRREEKRREDIKEKGANAPAPKFSKPSLSELITEFNTRVADPLSEANKFLNYYESNGWKVGRNPMKSWQHAVTNWVGNNKQRAPPPQASRIIEHIQDRSWAGE